MSGLEWINIILFFDLIIIFLIFGLTSITDPIFECLPKIMGKCLPAITYTFFLLSFCYYLLFFVWISLLLYSMLCFVILVFVWNFYGGFLFFYYFLLSKLCFRLCWLFYYLLLSKLCWLLSRLCWLFYLLFLLYF